MNKLLLGLSLLLLSHIGFGAEATNKGCEEKVQFETQKAHAQTVAKLLSPYWQIKYDPKETNNEAVDKILREHFNCDHHDEKFFAEIIKELAKDRIQVEHIFPLVIKICDKASACYHGTPKRCKTSTILRIFGHLCTDSYFDLRYTNFTSEDHALCEEVAVALKNPFLYEPSKFKSFHPRQVSFNLLWILPNYQDRHQDSATHIFGDFLDNDQEKLDSGEKRKNQVYGYLKRWADKNPGASISLWYDSSLVTQRAKDQTLKDLELISEKCPHNTIRLRDVRDIKIPDLPFCDMLINPMAPLHLRVDLLKAYISESHMRQLSKELASKRYCLVLDCDIEPNSLTKKIDATVFGHLNCSGYLFLKKRGQPYFENGALMFDLSREDVKKAHYDNFLKGQAESLFKHYELSEKDESEMCISNQTIFQSYSGFFSAVNEQGSCLDPYVDRPRIDFETEESQYNLFSGIDIYNPKNIQSEKCAFFKGRVVTRNGRFHPEASERLKSHLKAWRNVPLVNRKLIAAKLALIHVLDESRLNEIKDSHARELASFFRTRGTPAIRAMIVRFFNPELAKTAPVEAIGPKLSDGSIATVGLEVQAIKPSRSSNYTPGHKGTIVEIKGSNIKVKFDHSGKTHDINHHKFVAAQ